MPEAGYPQIPRALYRIARFGEKNRTFEEIPIFGENLPVAAGRNRLYVGGKLPHYRQRLRHPSAVGPHRRRKLLQSLPISLTSVSSP